MVGHPAGGRAPRESEMDQEKLVLGSQKSAEFSTTIRVGLHESQHFLDFPRTPKAKVRKLGLKSLQIHTPPPILHLA
jgi:hypothetical protein